jgi:hypothetical protein
VCPFAAAAAAAVIATSGRSAVADPADQLELNERCATRLSIAMLGKSPDPGLFTSPSPQASVDAMLTSADFYERFARFINAAFNPTPGTTPDEDAAYFMAKKVLAEGRPWADMFVGNSASRTARSSTIPTASVTSAAPRG